MLERMRIKEHMEVVDFDGNHVGTVDEVENERIKLTKSDSSDDKHHYLQLDSVAKIAENRIYLEKGTKLPVGMGNKAQMETN